MRKTRQDVAEGCRSSIHCRLLWNLGCKSHSPVRRVPCSWCCPSPAICLGFLSSGVHPGFSSQEAGPRLVVPQSQDRLGASQALGLLSLETRSQAKTTVWGLGLAESHRIVLTAVGVRDLGRSCPVCPGETLCVSLASLSLCT